MAEGAGVEPAQVLPRGVSNPMPYRSASLPSCEWDRNRTYPAGFGVQLA